MAKAISGEVSLMVGKRRRRLRLDIGTMMDLEDHFNMGLVPFLTERFPEFRLKDLAVLFVAMTSGDFSDNEAVKRAASTIVKAGVAEAATAISRCLEATLMPAGTADSHTTSGVPGKP
jgi:hypothetical protein